MNAQHHQGLAAKIALFATSMLPPDLKDWGTAMRYEVEAIPAPQKAAIFAIGCLFFACGQRIVFSSKQLLEHLVHNPNQMIAWCAIFATGLGLVHLALANAPVRHLVMNASALGLGFIIVAVATWVTRNAIYDWAPISLVLAALVLLTSLFGINAEGATRWVSLGGVSIQPSFLVVPIVAIIFARDQNALTTSAIILTSIALAMQPDRGMSGALAAGMFALALVQPTKHALIASVTAICGFLVATLQTDSLPATPQVDQIYFSSFAIHPFSGIAVLTGAVLLLAPAVIVGSSGRSDYKVHCVFGAVWSALGIAAALGNYPPPILGYGGSAIIGYVVCMLGFAKPFRRVKSVGQTASNTDGQQKPTPELRAVQALACHPLEPKILVNKEKCYATGNLSKALFQVAGPDRFDGGGLVHLGRDNSGQRCSKGRFS